jgi:diguanylate cyclase (GGDEF)-like protein
MASLSVIEGPSAGQTILLTHKMTIGSDPSASHVIDDRRIAARQAEFSVSGRTVLLRNLEPRRELLVNSQTISAELQLQHGDLITIGESLLLFNEDPTPSVERPAAGRDTIRLRRPLGDSRIEPMVLSTGDAASRRIEALLRAANEIREIDDEDTLLHRLLELIFAVIPADRGVVLVPDEDGALIERSYRDRRGSTEPPRISRTIIKEVLNTREAVLLVNPLDDNRFLSGKSIFENSIFSAICLPLLFRDQLHGIVHLDSSSWQRLFTEDDLQLATGIGHQAAGALVNLRVLQRRRQHTQDLINLSNLTQKLSSYLDKATIYRETVRLAGTLADAERVSLVLYSGSTRRTTLRIVSALGIDDADWSRIAVDTQGLIGEVLRSNEPMFQGVDSDTAVTLHYTPNSERYRSNSFVIMPISSKREIFEYETPAFGALCVTEKRDGRRFDQRDLQLLEILANQAGIALTNAELYERATVDQLTKVYVRRFFMIRMEELAAACRGRGQPLALAMLDLDHFKQVNDELGHQTGDIVLRELGLLIKEHCRSQDLAGRYGGEEFVLLCVDTNLEQAAELIRTLHQAIQNYPFNRKRQRLALTASIGIAELAPDESCSDWLERTDRALYQAKHAGRNRMVLAR